MAHEIFEIVEPFGEYLGDQVEVDVQVSMDEHVPKTGNLPEPLPEARRQDIRLDQTVDRRSIGPWIIAQRLTEMCRYVESGLGRHLKPVFNGPPAVDIGAEFLRRTSGVPPQD